MGLILFMNSDLLPSATLQKFQIRLEASFFCANYEEKHSRTIHHKHLVTFFIELHTAPGFRWNNSDSEYRIIFFQYN